MNKQWYKDRIYGYELKVISLLTTDTRPKKQILKDCRAMLIKFSREVGLDSVEFNSLWIWTVNTYNRVRRKKQSPTSQFRNMEKEKNDVADRIEFRMKHSFYDNMSSVFYRCSTHTNCAEGHRAYQGRIYINTELANDSELEYATQNGIMDIREVMAAPVWLFTRKNCKHFFTPVPSELVMENKLPPEVIINDPPLNSPYRAYYDRKKLLIAVGVSKKSDSYKRTTYLIRKHKVG